MKGLPYEVKTLIQKARESAQLAVETYNRPTAQFRSGAYVVLMIIAWTALYHAIFIRKHVKPYYRKRNSHRFEKVDDEYKRWELSECMQQYFGDLNPAIRKNLEFFITLRNRLEHHSLAEIDPEIFGECQAMLLNFETVLVEQFGERYAIRGGLTFALQFSKSGPGTSLRGVGKVSQQKAFANVKSFIDRFRSSLSTEVQTDLAYSFKVFLVPKIGNHATGDAVAVEFVKYDASKPDEMKQYEKVVAMIKPKEIQVANLGLIKASAVVAQLSKRLGKKFTMYDHKSCYEHFNARPVRGKGDPAACDTRHCVYDDVHKDYCYKPEWVEFLATKLSDEATYAMIIQKKKSASAKPITPQGRAA
jgi:hypothetical protein